MIGGRDGHLRGLRLVWARSFGMTKPRSPKPSQRRRERKGGLRAAQEALEWSRGACLPQMTVAPAYHCSEAP